MKKFEGDFPPLSEFQERIEEDLKERKKTIVLKEWLNDLRKNAIVEINEDLLYKD